MYKWSLYNKNHTSITCYINFNLVVFSSSSLFVIDNIKQRWTSNWVSLVNLVSFTVFNSVERRRLSLDARYQEEKKERQRKTNKDKRNSSIILFLLSSVCFFGAGKNERYQKWLNFHHSISKFIFISFSICRKFTHRSIFKSAAAKEKAKIENCIHQPSNFRAWEAISLPKISFTRRPWWDRSCTGTVQCSSEYNHIMQLVGLQIFRVWFSTSF